MTVTASTPTTHKGDQMAEPHTRHSLLDDALISVTRASEEHAKMSLPQILAGLERDEIVAFRALQPHQWQPWFSFLVQVAAMAVARQGAGQRPDTAEAWRDLLVGLADGSEAAWCMVVDDLSEPAFMQPPVPEGSLADAKYKADTTTPALLDMLVTSKNHDVKRTRIRNPEVEHWLFALLTLQTLEGFLGVGNYGIVRMNGGFSARPFVGFTPSLDWPTRYKRDVDCLSAARSKTIERFEYTPDGHALLWLEPWDGGKQSGYQLDELDPYFVEICRRIRFTDEDALVCWRSNTKATRVDTPKSFAGITGDPWTPIVRKDTKSMNVGASGFPYPLVRELLLGEEYDTPAALEIDNGTSGGFFVGVGLARGQGKTDGFHRRIVPIPDDIAAFMASDSRRQHLAGLSRERIELAAEVRERVLRPALYRVIGGGESANVDYEEIQRWEDAYAAEVDDEFFPALWAHADLDEDEASELWQGLLYNVARNQLEDVIDAAPISAARRYRVVAAAESIFLARAGKVLPTVIKNFQKVTREQQGDAHDATT
jgi:CRISPR system Cascade subunit CasA